MGARHEDTDSERAEACSLPSCEDPPAARGARAGSVSALIEAVEQALEVTRVEPDTRISFRLLSDERGVIAQPLLQRRSERGRWSAGSVVAAEKLMRGGEVALDALEEQIVAHLVEGARYPWVTTPRRIRTLQLLDLLSQHPRVFFASSATSPVLIERAALSLSFLVDGELFSPVLSASGRAVEVSELAAKLDERGNAVLVDEAAQRVRIVSLDAVGQALVRALSGVSLRLDAGEVRSLAVSLSGASQSLVVEAPAPANGASFIEAERRPWVRVEPRAPAGVVVRFSARAARDAASHEVGEGPEVVATAAGWARRQLAQERVLAQQAAEALGLRGEGPWTLDSDEQALLLIERLTAALRDGVVADAERGEGALPKLVAPGTLRLQVGLSKRAWLSVSGELLVAGSEAVPLSALLDAAAAQRAHVSAGGRRFVALEGELRARLVVAAVAMRASRQGLEAGPHGVRALLSLAETSEVQDEGGLLAGWRERLARAASLEPALPTGLVTTLRPYQLEGYRWMARLGALGAGGCLCDEMGLGKTVQTLALLLSRAAQGPQLVVAPTSVGPNWVAEATRFAPGLHVILAGAKLRERATPGPNDVLVYSYDQLARDVGWLSAQRFTTLVLDEAQLVKNPARRRAKAARAIEAELKIALTGTPVENHLGELWSIFELVVPGLLGGWDRFRERFGATDERARAAQLAALSTLLRPFLLRRTRAEVAPDLPDRVEVLRLIEPSADERALYEQAQVRAKTRAAKAGKEGRVVLLAELTRLRRLACHPKLVDEGSEVASTKLEAFLSLWRELAPMGHKALVFSQFTSHLALVREALDEAGQRYLYLDGETPRDERMRRVEAFQRGEAPLFLISLRAGGTGLNLTAADTVIHLDPWWNPAAEEQASSRAYRIGQSRSVTVVRLIAAGTIEQSVLALQAEKRELACALLDGDGPSGPSADELLSLLLSSEAPQRP